LMVANKILDDNSYRSETFSSVSGIPLADLNLMEMSFLGALKFDTNLDRFGWTNWLSQLLDRERMKKFEYSLKVDEVLGEILQKSCEEISSEDSITDSNASMTEMEVEGFEGGLNLMGVISSPGSLKSLEIEFDEEFEEENPIPGEYNSRRMSFYQNQK